MTHRYDLHCHTNAGSKCSDISTKNMVELYREMGYSGICITDHLSGSMNPLPGSTPWEDRITFHHSIYQEARKWGEKAGLSVFFGVEFALVEDINDLSKTTWGKFVLLNLEKEWLINNRAVFVCEPDRLFSKVREAGGFVIHAHPFIGKRELVQLFPDSIDAVEVINTGCDSAANAAALNFAREHKLLEVAGTDIHRYDQKLMAGVETEKPCATIGELIAAIKAGNAKPFTVEREITDYWQRIQADASEERKNRNK